MKKAGLTGGIGSGKTMVCCVFTALGVPVYHADGAARRLMETDETIRQSLKDLLGDDIYKGNEPDRNRIAELIFKDAQLLRKVNTIIHPRVADDFSGWCIRHKDSPYVIHESALLFESNFYRLFDIAITVTCPVDIRLQRILSREGMTRQKAERIMRNQLSEDEKITRSHYHINNDGHTLVLPQVLKIHSVLNVFENN
jgi:dephospho-CoA kinase